VGVADIERQAGLDIEVGKRLDAPRGGHDGLPGPGRRWAVARAIPVDAPVIRVLAIRGARVAESGADSNLRSDAARNGSATGPIAKPPFRWCG
jgi:hypothetical protein